MNRFDNGTISAALRRVGILDRLRLSFEIITMANLYDLARGMAKMSRAARAVLVVAVLAYVVFFLWMADRAPRVAFAAGILLGAVLVGLWLVSILGKHDDK